LLLAWKNIGSFRSGHFVSHAICFPFTSCNSCFCLCHRDILKASIMPVTFSKPLPQCHTKRDRDQVLALWSMIEKHLPQRSLKRVTHQLEFGAGKAEATRQAQDMKLQAIGCDRDDKCIEDGVVVKLNYTDAKGFGQSVRHVLRVVECGTVIFAIQCSSLVFLSRSTSGRDTWRPPLCTRWQQRDLACQCLVPLVLSQECAAFGGESVFINSGGSSTFRLACQPGHLGGLGHHRLGCIPG